MTIKAQAYGEPGVATYQALVEYAAHDAARHSPADRIALLKSVAHNNALGTGWVDSVMARLRELEEEQPR